MRLCIKLSLIISLSLLSINLVGQQLLKDKTLVVWASLDNLDQKGGSALTLDDGHSNFDGIVFGEIEDRKWMAGSNSFARTQKDQTDYPLESADSNDFVQMAIVYEANKISIFRNGLPYSSHDIQDLQAFEMNEAIVLFGLRHLDSGDKKNTFTGKILDARIYSEALSEEQLKSLISGTISEGPEPWAWWDFNKHGLQDVTRRFTEFDLRGEAFIQDGALVLKGNGASLISFGKSEKSDTKTEFKVSKTVIENTRSFREKLLSDPYRPAYHFCVPEDMGYPGDPNGAFYHDGRYHLMYLYNREGSGFCWGHVSSSDLLHWRHHPDGIGPGAGDEGCFSGGGFVDDDGSAYLSYWMLWGDKGIGMAKSIDKDFNSWEKLDNNPVIKSSEWGITEMKDSNGKEFLVGSADPSNIWKKDGKYYMLCGNLLVLNKIGREKNSPENEKGDRLYLFESNDLINWSYLHRFYESDRKWTEASEDNMCPSFLPLPKSPDGGESSNKNLLLFISHNLGCQYYIGDYRDDHFYPAKHGRMTWNDNSYFAPEALVDGQGRQIMWSWIFDDRPENMKSEYGWTGTYGLPRSLWLNKEGELGIRPVKELENIRMDEQSMTNFNIDPDEELNFDSLGEELMELELDIEMKDAESIEIALCTSKDGKEKTKIIYNSITGKLEVDTQKSSLRYGKKVIESAPFKLKKNERLKLRIYVDRSIIEVYANDRQAIARRIYPTLGGKGIRISSLGGRSKLASIKRWRMSPTNPY